MAVQSDTSSISYTGNNSTSTSYAVPFVFLENAHLAATAKVTATGVETAVTLTNHTGAGDVNGGTVRTAVAVPATSTLTIFRTVPATQTTTYQEGGDFPAASHERALDKLTMISQQLKRDITNATATFGFQTVQSLSFTANGSFVKALYPWAKIVRMFAVGGGGGGGGAATTSSSQVAVGGSGSGAGAGVVIVDVDDLSASVAITVGAGGAGGAAGNNAGSSGGDSSFGSFITAKGGLGGSGGAAVTAPVIVNGTAVATANVATTVYSGSPALPTYATAAQVIAPVSGSSIAGTAVLPTATTSGANGANATLFGSGGSGGCNAENQASARSGGSGSSGIVIVEILG
jgi:hypothetical protein